MRRNVDRTERINLLVSSTEKQMVRELAQKAGLTVTDFIRQAIRTAHAALPTDETAP